MRRMSLPLLLGTVLLGAAGCNEYHYYDVTVSLDNTLRSNTIMGGIQRCDVTIKKEKGGIEDTFLLTRSNSDNGCPLADTSEGSFEYSTFKSSGSLSFTIAAYDDVNTKPECKIGEGEATIPAKATTNEGTVTVMANGAAGCK
jgi:hypothetical protein